MNPTNQANKNRFVPFKVIDLFAGVGGLSYGFSKDPSFQIIAANEILADMAKAYRLNHPSVKTYHSDVRDFTLETLSKDLGIKKGEVSVIVGGPPCQAYSTVGKRKPDDPRRGLLGEYHRILKEFEPQFFVFENVKGLLSIDKGKLFQTILKDFENLGFFVKYKVLNAADYGTPQSRERIIVTGSRLNDGFEFPKPTHGEGLKPCVTLREAIGDLALIETSKSSVAYSSESKTPYQKQMRANAGKMLNDHDAPKNSAKMIALMEALEEGGSAKDLPDALRPKSGYKNTYAKLWWDKPATTITRNLGTPSSSRCIHPQAPRPLTTREGARLQGFPDDYRFYGSRTSKNLQIGNAVPTQISRALAEAIKNHFKNEI